MQRNATLQVKKGHPAPPRAKVISQTSKDANQTLQANRKQPPNRDLSQPSGPASLPDFFSSAELRGARERTEGQSGFLLARGPQGRSLRPGDLRRLPAPASAHRGATIPLAKNI